MNELVRSQPVGQGFTVELTREVVNDIERYRVRIQDGQDDTFIECGQSLFRGDAERDFTYAVDEARMYAEDRRLEMMRQGE